MVVTRPVSRADAVSVPFLGSLKQVAHEPPVAKRGAARGIRHGEQLRRALTSLHGELIAAISDHRLEDLQQLFGAVVVESDCSVEPRCKAGVGCEEPVHLVWLASDDACKPVA